MQKAQSIQARMSSGYVRFPAHAPWIERARAEMLKFPNGKHDDFVDTISLIGRGLTKQLPAAKEEALPLTRPEMQVGTFGWVKHQHQKEKRARRAIEVLGGM